MTVIFVRIVRTYTVGLSMLIECINRSTRSRVQNRSQCQKWSTCRAYVAHLVAISKNCETCWTSRVLKHMAVMCAPADVSGTHRKTGFHSLKWTVPDTQTVYSICQCKHTKNPPYCDGTHNNLPSEVDARQSQCKRRADGHTADCKLCTSCGWKPDF